MENQNDNPIILSDAKAYALRVQQMRTAQKNFFEAQKAKYAGSPAGSAAMPIYLKQSKALEKEVDILTNEIILGQKQGNLF